MNPVGDAPLRTRADAQRAVRDLVAPLLERASTGGAHIRPGETGASFSNRDAEVEGFARPLWGLAPLTAGGGRFDGWDRYRDGLVNGTDPEHPEYWGPLGDYSQKAVELAPIGVALALAPDRLWDPLSTTEREQIQAWIRDAETVDYPDSNWLWFRVLALLGLRSVDAAHDWAVAERDLERLESFALEDGWYEDGPDGHCDYYAAWELHTDALVYGALVDDDEERIARFHEHAEAFAEEFRYWFAADGSALPYGRSLTYRFAQGAFWGALAFADCEALPWGQIRGLWQRHLRWWFAQPIFTDGGILSLGYRYPTLKTTETYNSPSSPYWGLKAFLPLALPESHPFWAAEPEPLPELEAERVQASPKMVVCRDRGPDYDPCPGPEVTAENDLEPESASVTALVAGTDAPYVHKYNKFAYSTAFGFGVGSDIRGIENAGPDSTLALSEDGTHFRTRADVDSSLDDGIPHSRWQPWPDVTVETWLVPAPPWHVRVHRLETERSVRSVDGGFALDRRGSEECETTHEREEAGLAFARYPAGCSGLRDLRGSRTGELVAPDPNTNVIAPRTTVPALRGTHDRGEEWLVTAVMASTDADDRRWDRQPTLTADDGVRLESADGTALFERD